ncbi:hypothetical protein D3C76_1862020 [compost metagenome]
MHNVTIGGYGSDHLDTVLFLQSPTVELLLHGKARTEQPNATNILLAHLQRSGVGDVDQR